MAASGVLGKRALIAGSAVAALVVGAVAILAIGGGSEQATVVAQGAPAGATASTTTPAGPTIPTNPRGLSGWGTAQPNAMAATVMYGTSNTRMTPAQREKWAGQLEQARAAALKIGTVRNALAMGYVKNFQYVDGRGYEYIKWSNFKHTLDLDQPTTVNFPSDDPDARVASVAYQVLGTREDGPPDDLPLSVIPWHFHSNLCKKGNSIVGNIETAPDGTLYKRQVERCKNLGAVPQPQLNHWMVDLWVVPGWENPWGLVSSKHPDLMRTPVPWFTDTNVAGSDINQHH